jgi:hypothetical protein
VTAVIVPDRVGEPIRAFRMWRVDEQRRRQVWRDRYQANDGFGTLLPFNHPLIDQRWLGGSRLVAQCAQNDDFGERMYDHHAPDPSCRCGVYGFKQLAWVEQPLLQALADLIQEYSRSFTGRSRFRLPQEGWLAVGSVLLWGKVIEGAYGYRAQYAYPETIWLLPPARVGGEDKTVIDEKTVALATDLLVALRGRYRWQVGYATHDPDVARLVASDETGWFFSWRLNAWGADRFARALGEIGLPSVGLPTVADALRLWLENRRAARGNALWMDNQLVREHLRPAFGHIPIDQSATLSRVEYTPISRSSGRPYASRTVARHLAVLEQAIKLAAERWLFRDLDRAA